MPFINAPLSFMGTRIGSFTSKSYTGSLLQGGVYGVVLTSSGTLTIPAGVIQIQVLLGGGGGGGAPDGVAPSIYGNAGGATYFGEFINIAGGNPGWQGPAGGANAGGAGVGGGGSGGTAYSGGATSTGVAGGAPGGGTYGQGSGGGGGANIPSFGLVGIGGTGNAENVGDGGPGQGTDGSFPSSGGAGGGGNTGGYNAGAGGGSVQSAFTLLTVIPFQQIVVTIGAGGPQSQYSLIGGGSWGMAGGAGFAWVQIVL